MCAWLGQAQCEHVAHMLLVRMSVFKFVSLTRPSTRSSLLLFSTKACGRHQETSARLDAPLLGLALSTVTTQRLKKNKAGARHGEAPTCGAWAPARRPKKCSMTGLKLCQRCDTNCADKTVGGAVEHLELSQALHIHQRLAPGVALVAVAASTA